VGATCPGLQLVADTCRPPTAATLVKCQRCGQEYDTTRIEERFDGDADRPQWCCPIAGCSGRSFGFNILPVNRQYHIEEGDWDPLIAFFPDASRRHQVHYHFAHRFLPNYVHDDPYRFFRPICQEAPTFFIHEMWNKFLHMAGLIRGDRLRRVSDLTMNLQQLAGRLVALIEMPTPEAPNEAFFVAVVLLAAAPQELSPKKASARVFTLEAVRQEISVAGEAVFGEWARDGSHLNYGGIPCNREAFLQFVARQVGRDREMHEVIARINLGQSVQFRDQKGIPSLWHDPEQMQVLFRPVAPAAQETTRPVFCPACTAVLRPWREDEQQQTCPLCGHTILLA
jgi:hypothetical protein